MSDEAVSNVIVLTRAEVEARVESAAQKYLGVDRVTAFEMLDRGDLDGTLMADVLNKYRYLLRK